MSPARGTYVMADLDARGDLQLKADYRYDVLERVPGAADLIGRMSGLIWRSPDAFEEPIPTGEPDAPGDPAGTEGVAPAEGGGPDASGTVVVTLRWRSSSPSAGIATLRVDGRLLSVTLLVCGLSADQDALTLNAFQSHLLRELHDTGIEPSFDLLGLAERPLAATINFGSPDAPVARRVAALADRCFAAAYFRYHGLV